MLRDDHGERREGRGRAQDRADIVRIGHLIEQQEDMRLGLARQRGEHIVELGLREGLGLEHEPLMHRVLRQHRLEGAALDRLGARRPLGRTRLGQEQRRFLDILAQAEKALHHAQRIGQRRGHRVPAVDELRAFRRRRRGVARLARARMPLLVPLVGRAAARRHRGV